MISRDTQHRLNQPFPFEEVLLSPKDRSRIQKGPVADLLFSNEPPRIEVTEYRLRELTVRLRTINNACDSMASLPDGRPITEVSMYGSRDRQYLVGPYEAVKRLIAGEWPSTETLLDKLNQDSRCLDGFIDTVEHLLAGIRAGKRLQNVQLCPRPARTGFFAIDDERWPLVQIWPDDSHHVETALAALKALQAELPPLIPEVMAWTHWWMPWTARAEDIRLHSQEWTQSTVQRVEAVFAKLQEQVFAPG